MPTPTPAPTQPQPTPQQPTTFAPAAPPTTQPANDYFDRLNQMDQAYANLVEYEANLD